MPVLNIRVTDDLLAAIDAASGNMKRSEYARCLIERALFPSIAADQPSIVVAEPSKSPAPPRSPVVTSTHLRDRSADIAHLRTIMAGERLTLRQIAAITGWIPLRIDKAINEMGKAVIYHGSGVMSLST